MSMRKENCWCDFLSKRQLGVSCIPCWDEKPSMLMLRPNLQLQRVKQDGPTTRAKVVAST